MSSAPIPDAAILPPRLDAALTRFERGLAALETAVAQRLENEMSLADLEEELAVMQDDRGRLALDLDLFSRGGMRVLDKIERQDYDVLRARPAISKFERARLLLGSLARLAMPRAA